MSRGQVLRGQMSPWQLEYVLNVHRNLPLKFHQNRVSNSWDIANIEFLWVVGGGGGVSTLKRTLVRLDVWLLQSIPSSLLFDALCLNSRLASEFWILCLNLRLVSQFWALCLNSRLMSEFWALCLNSRLMSEFEACVWILSLCLNSGVAGNVFHWRAKSADQC